MVKMIILSKAIYRFNAISIRILRTKKKKNTKGIFHRTRKNNVKICMETQKTLKSQNNFEEEQRRKNHAP